MNQNRVQPWKYEDDGPPPSTTLDYGLEDPGRFTLLVEVFIPGLCIFALMICCTRVVFAYLRHRLDQQFYERHGMTRGEFIASVDTMEANSTDPRSGTMTEREWRLRQLASFSVPPSPPTYDEVSKQPPPPTYAQSRSLETRARSDERRRRRDHPPPSAPPAYSSITSISSSLPPQSDRGRSLSAPPIDDLSSNPSPIQQLSVPRLSVHI